jgi:hypothetical protein
MVLLDFNVADRLGKQVGLWGMLGDGTRHSRVGLQHHGRREFSHSIAGSAEVPTLDDQPVTLADFAATLDKGGDILTESSADLLDFTPQKPASTGLRVTRATSPNFHGRNISRERAVGVAPVQVSLG